MKKIKTLLLALLPLFAIAQNVGVGTSTPSERLHVNGNINVTGTIKTNGTDGTAGQVLMKNGSGNLAWGDMCEYKNLVIFDFATSNWTVPAGVTKIWVEAWGGGGGGNSWLGGGGGGYISGIIPVVAGNTVNVIVGLNGTGDYSSPQSGQESRVTYGSVILQAYGGEGAAYLGGTAFVGFGGLYAASSGFTSYIGIAGQSGQTSKNRIMQVNATQFYDVCEGGNGGNAGNTTSTGGIGGYLVQTTTVPYTAIRTTNNMPGTAPGGGGGSGTIALNLAALGFPGATGGMGRVIIHY